MENLYSKQVLDISGWEREEHYRFFSTFTQPFFNVHTELDITPLYRFCKQHKLPVSLAYMHTTVRAVRATENFLLRIEGGQVIKFSAVDLSTTILKDNNTFSFVHLPHKEDLAAFCSNSAAIIALVRQSKQMMHGHQGNDVLHMTTLPWFKFNGMEHARTIDPDDSVPKFAYGRLEFKNERVLLPMSISVHHGLADGYHIHLLVKEMERIVETYA